MEAEFTETRPTDDGGVEPTQDAPEPPPADPPPLDYPLQSLQPMPPPPPRVDEDETMDIVPDSEPSRVADGPMSSLHLPGLESRVHDATNDEGWTLESAESGIINGKERARPKSPSKSDITAPEHSNTDRGAQDPKEQEPEAETEQEDDPMDSQPLVKQRPKRPPKPVLEEEDDDEEEVHQEVRDNTVVPETDDEVPLAAMVKPTKTAPKPLPPRGRSMRNKRPIVYTESPDTSENEVSAVKFRFTFVVLT